MASFKPLLPYTTPLVVLKPTITKVGGVRAKVIPDVKDGFQIFASFKSYGGTEQTVDGIYSIIDTASVETWYRPDITSDCIVVLTDTGAQYEIISEPENIDRRNQFMKFTVKRLKGGV